jgi:uncharacterized membrane protein YcjF (UPF0283 family)
MLSTFWKTVKTAVLILGVLLSFFVIIELLRAYQTLYELHPVAGYLFVGLLVLGIIWLTACLVITLVSRPPVLIPPAITDPEHPAHRELLHYIKYLKKYITRLSTNDSLTAEDRNKASESLAELSSALDGQDDLKVLLLTIQKAENNIINPLLSNLDEQAGRQVRNSTRDVMVAVTFSPYKAADLMIVLYRNLVRIPRIVRIYNIRPRVREQLSTFVDTIGVVATVNFLNMGKSILENLGSKVPGIGKFLDDITQGIGAGFMTSVAGHAAMDRCRAFKGWNAQEAKIRLHNRAAEFFSDVKDIFWVDIIPGIRSRLGDISMKQWNKIKDGIASVLDETGNVIGKFVREPIAKAGKGIATAGLTGSRSVLKASSNVFSKLRGLIRRRKVKSD